ncbi:PucC family protein [Ruixingdingia sedimenti]|uniref:PucC family protein n=1 Tax=Ruixingdingia sedimenti TaxID=3073604 RepID=A0ABU1FCL3_9RHOB|nr:PucC family protein [Xinfangfangia sp. LG-4]MDR5654605.1 PucC family protein [Xinfangfangia sp. LG-4]
MTLGWAGILRIGVVQMSLGAVVVLMTSTLNRLMVVEFALPAVLPGALVAFYYGIQITRPNWGFLADTGGSRTRWVLRGMAALAAGAFLAAWAVTLLDTARAAALALSVLAYGLIGIGVGAAGTSALALLAIATAPARRAAAAALTWGMMIFGIAATATIAGGMLDPYGPGRLLAVVGVVTAGALVATVLAVWRIDRGLPPAPPPESTPLRAGLAEIWAEPAARRFTLFVFLSMLAYFMQELILEPFGGLVFAMTPGQTTTLSGMQNGGVLAGMIVVAVAGTGLGWGSLRVWVTAGCAGSAGALAAIAAVGAGGTQAMLWPAVAGLGLFNGMFAVAAVGAMMALAGQGRAAREGTRMGLWGAAQAVAAGSGGFLGAALADLLRLMLPPAPAFGAVFLAEAALFLAAAVMAWRVIAAPGARAGATA